MKDLLLHINPGILHKRNSTALISLFMRMYIRKNHFLLTCQFCSKSRKNKWLSKRKNKKFQRAVGIEPPKTQTCTLTLENKNIIGIQLKIKKLDLQTHKLILKQFFNNFLNGHSIRFVAWKVINMGFAIFTIFCKSVSPPRSAKVCPTDPGGGLTRANWQTYKNQCLGGNKNKNESIHGANNSCNST